MVGQIRAGGSPDLPCLSALHANIQDVFNEYGMQIMSPQYSKDPPVPKTVAEEHWYTEPARLPEG